MQEFDETFRDGVSEVNRLRVDDIDVQDALNRYNGRSFVLAVEGDGVYAFHISANGVRYVLNPSSVPNDMYARMDIRRARKLVYTQNLGLFDILTIEHRNIGLGDIEFIKSLFSKKRR